MKEVEADQVRVMSFVPQVGTPLANHPPGDLREEAKIIAVLRLLFPHRLIPASLDVGGLEGLADRLNAGANVVTSLVPPGRGLAGVARWSLGIDDARRTAASVAPVLGACGLSIASREEFFRWMEARGGSVVQG
jgi:methylornithine synthase